MSTKSIREKFVKDFGEEQAEAIENAANKHDNDIHSNRGSDSFKWALLIAIGYECITKTEYKKYHGITIPTKTIKDWIKKYGKLGSHDGDADYLSMAAGVYNEYMPKSKIIESGVK